MSLWYNNEIITNRKYDIDETEIFSLYGALQHRDLLRNHQRRTD